MQRLLYQSIANDGVGTKDVFEIIETSSRNNPDREVTGFLIHDADRFLQLLEGPPLAVEGLVAHIERDPRHRDLTVLLRQTAQERWFPDWSMKQLINFGAQPAMEEIRGIVAQKEGGEELQAALEAFLAAG